MPDKALVENAVDHQRIYAPLAGPAPSTRLEELNAAIRPLLEQHNARRFQRLPYSRRELFEQIEQHTLAPLPAHHFPLQHIREVTVQFKLSRGAARRPALLQRALASAHPRSAHQGQAALRRAHGLDLLRQRAPGRVPA